MKRPMIASWAVLASLVGCQDVPENESVTPDRMFLQESKPVGDPSTDPYRPEVIRPLINLPLEPPPETAPPAGNAAGQAR